MEQSATPPDGPLGVAAGGVAGLGALFAVPRSGGIALIVCLLALLVASVSLTEQGWFWGAVIAALGGLIVGYGLFLGPVGEALIDQVIHRDPGPRGDCVGMEHACHATFTDRIAGQLLVLGGLGAVAVGSYRVIAVFVEGVPGSPGNERPER